MVKVFLKRRSCYPVNKSLVKKITEDYLSEKGIGQDIELCVNIVGSRKMRQLNKKYRGKDEEAVILSFPCQEVGPGKAFVSPPDIALRLGDIVISYPQLLGLAREENKLVDEKVKELVLHGLKCLVEGEQK